MRIALKPVANNPSTSDATPSKASGSGSFLDILSQGTQDAVQGSRGAGAHAQSDAHGSGQPSSHDQAPQGSSQNSVAKASTSQASTPALQKQTTPPSASPSGNEQGAKSSSLSESNHTQAKTSSDLAMLDATYLLANSSAAIGGSGSAQSSSTTNPSSASPAASGGKQTGTTKGLQGKQPSTPGAAVATDPSLLQQILTATLPVITMPAVAPQATFAQPMPPSTTQTAVPNLNADAASASVPVQAAQPDVTAAIAAAKTLASSQGQQGATGTDSYTNTQVPSAPATQFAHDLANATTTAKAATAALKAALSGGMPDASGSAQASAAKPVQNSSHIAPSQPIANTFFSAAIAQNDNAANQAVGKVIPLKVAATNLGADANPAGSSPTSSNNTSSTSAVSSPASKNNSQDSSNSASSSSRDGQTGNDAASGALTGNTQAPNGAVQSDSSAQPFVLSATAAHGSAQASASPSTTDTPPSHLSESRSLPAEGTHVSLPAGSSAINTARVIQNMNETEMRVGMRSTEFGDISIRTMVTQQQMQTQISVDHSELVNALTAHIPAVQAKLGADYGLHASIEVSQGGASFTNQQQQSSQRDYKPFTPSTPFDGTVVPVETERIVPRTVVAAIAGEGSRLDIRA